MAFDGESNSKYLLSCKEKLEETRGEIAVLDRKLKEAALEQEVLATMNTQRRAELVASNAFSNHDAAALTARRDAYVTRRAALKAAVDYLEAQVPPPPPPQ